MNEQADQPIAVSFLNFVALVDQLARTRLERRLPDGLRISHFAVLQHLATRPGPFGPARIAVAFQVSKGAVTNTLKRLEDRGLVAIVPDPDDGRAKNVTLTDTGREAYDSCVESIGPLLDDLRAHVSDSELETAMPILQKISDHLQRG